MKALRIIAGHEARQQLQQSGWKPELFQKFIAASGGPKWLPMAALDRAILVDWIPKEQPIQLLGTSSGAWRCAALSHPDPKAAHMRLLTAYIEQRYETKPSPSEVQAQCQGILESMLGDAQWDQLAQAPNRSLNVIACRWRGIKLGQKGKQMLSLAATAAVNLASRTNLNLLWERWVFGGQGFLPLDDLDTHHAQLTADNLLKVLLASGSIPLLSPGEVNISGAKSGLYMDGGLTDYHLDLPSLRQGGLTLYPHFHSYVVPGWFDKPLGSRRGGANLNKVVMLAPTEAFIRSLPGAKLPTRDDFSKLSSDQRIERWHQIQQMGQQLAMEFSALVRGDSVIEIEKLD